MSEIRKRIFERIEELAEQSDCDGISATGEYSASVHSAQKSYIDGMRMGALAAANVASPPHRKDEP